MLLTCIVIVTAVWRTAACLRCGSVGALELASTNRAHHKPTALLPLLSGIIQKGGLHSHKAIDKCLRAAHGRMLIACCWDANAMPRRRGNRDVSAQADCVWSRMRRHPENLTLISSQADYGYETDMMCSKSSAGYLFGLD